MMSTKMLTINGSSSIVPVAFDTCCGSPAFMKRNPFQFRAMMLRGEENVQWKIANH